MNALIGHSGYVGSALRRQQTFDALFRSTDVGDAAGRAFDAVVCAAAPAQKWIAERDPEADRANLARLADIVESIDTPDFTLVSTVDVFDDSRGKTEDDSAAGASSAYGRNRLWLEERVRARFPDALIVRLPGLVGPGLRKNAIFDFLNDNNVHLIDHRGVYQFYPMVNLTADLATARAAGLRLVHFSAEPMSIAAVAAAFGLTFDNEVAGRTPARYDLRSNHASTFGGADGYLYSSKECALAIRAYAQSEPRSAPIA